MCDFIIKHGTILTMNPARQIIEDGAVAILDDRILAVGTTQEITTAYQARKEIDASRKVIMPGLIDGHAHAGHALVKSMGVNQLDAWGDACFQIYQRGSDEEFWYADAQLSALERLKCGTTTSVNLLGGGSDIMRSDDIAYSAAHIEAIQNVGIREFLAVGPGRPPFPKQFLKWNGSSSHEVMIDFEKQMQVSEEVIQRWHHKGDHTISISIVFPVYNPSDGFSASELADIKSMARCAHDLSKQYGVLFAQDGHRQGTILFAHEELHLSGPDCLFAHNINLTAEEIELCAQTGTKIVHNPSAILSILGRCPVPELLDAGVTVLLGSDGVGPDRSYDMFRHMSQAMHYHRTYFRDPSILPAGKVLEMVTIDAARGLGMENEIGSLEVGKKADIILIDMYKPHLVPMNMAPYRVAHYANGADVDTVFVNGKMLMENRQVKTVVENEVLDRAQNAAQTSIERTGLHPLLDIPERFWGHSRF
jgi:cytosine/adenosine deaminase-related metal-dependent hydrolase